MNNLQPFFFALAPPPHITLSVPLLTENMQRERKLLREGWGRLTKGAIGPTEACLLDQPPRLPFKPID